MNDEGYIDGPGGRIWYGFRNEDSPGIPLLVVHGGPGFLTVPDVVADLADERPVYFYDQLGCGRSARPADKSLFTIEHYVAELAAVRAALGLREVHLLGQSWGCMLVAEYLLRERPEGVRSLTLSGPLLSTPLWEVDQRTLLGALPEAQRAVVAEAERTGDFGDAYQEAMMDYYRCHICRLDPWPDLLLQALGQTNLDVYVTMWGPSEFTVTGTLKGHDLLPRLHEIAQPTLLLCGEHDEATPDTVRRYRDCLPRGAMAVLPHASHHHHLEQPDLFLAVVRDHLHRSEFIPQQRP
jgi:proline iminopeptidase